MKTVSVSPVVNREFLDWINSDDVPTLPVNDVVSDINDWYADDYSYEPDTSHREEFWSRAIADGVYQNTPAIDLM